MHTTYQSNKVLHCVYTKSDELKVSLKSKDECMAWIQKQTKPENYKYVTGTLGNPS